MRLKKSYVNVLASITMGAILLLQSCSLTCSTSNVEISLDCRDDATVTVLNAIEGLEESGSQNLSFEKGTYHFYPEMAEEQFVYISNHNDQLARIVFPLKNIKDLTIDGNGSTFIFHGRMIPFLIEDSSDITIKNLTIDFADSFHSEGVVVATNEEERSFDLKISSKYPYEIRNEQLTFVKPYYSHSMGQTMFFDAERKEPAYKTELCGVSTSKRLKPNYPAFEYKYMQDKNDAYIKEFGKESQVAAKEIVKGVVRIYGQKKDLPEVGMVLVMKGEQGINRFAPAFKVDNVKNFSAEGVVVHHAAGMGFLFENCENVDLYSCTIEPSNGRMISTTADATHFVGCRGKVSLRGCTFTNQLDDAMNVHGTYQEVMNVIDSHTIGVRAGHYQQLGFQVAKSGDKVGIVRIEESFHHYDKLTVESSRMVNGRYWLITFKEEIPSNIQAGDLVENLSAYPDVLVGECNISRNRARGLLISTPKSIIVRNNLFHTEMEAILLPVESGLWYESGNAANVTIEGNTFQDCNTSGLDRGVIRLHTDLKNSNTAFSNIVVKNNTFNHFDNLLLEISNVDGFEFSGNTITKSSDYAPIYGTNPAITVNHAKGVIFENNRYSGSATQILKTLDGSKLEFN
ncbi:MAG: right-handed parallel beta-helix repeat-containing protein [Rikenellaceae bacterium]